MNSELALNGSGQTPRRPAVARKTVRGGACEIHLADRVHLIRSQSARTPRGTSSVQSFESFMNDGSMPAGRRGAADAVPSGYL